MSEELNIDEKISAIDEDIKAQEIILERGKALKKLKETEEFQLVFIDGYLNVEAHRVFNQLINPRVSKAEDKASYLSQLETIKDIIRYIGDDSYPGTVEILARNAQITIDELITMKQELLTDSKGE